MGKHSRNNKNKRKAPKKTAAPDKARVRKGAINKTNATAGDAITATTGGAITATPIPLPAVTTRRVRNVITKTGATTDGATTGGANGEFLRHATRLAMYKLEHSRGAGRVMMSVAVVRLVKKYLEVQHPQWTMDT